MAGISCVRGVALVVLAGLAGLALGVLPARGADDLSLEERARIRGYIALLDADEGADRDCAEQELVRIGAHERALLEETRAAAKPEARRRIDALLARIADKDRTAAPGEWPSLRGGPQRSGVSGGGLPRTEPKLAWRVMIPDRNPLQGALVASAENVFALSADGTVRCLAAANGERRWLAVLDGGITSSAALSGSRIVVPTLTGVSALDITDGREAWTVPAVYGCRAAPAIVGGTAFVALRNQGVLGVDVRTGETLFERKLAPQGALLADTDLLVTGTEDGELRSLDPVTGKDRWHVMLGGAPVMGPTLAAPGVLVVMAKDRTIQALRVGDGSRVWTIRAGFQSPSESIASAAGRIFVTDTAGFVRSYDAATGRELWNRCEGFKEMGAPAASADAVCFGARGRLVCRDAASGDYLWRIDVDRHESSSPVAAGGSLFVLDSEQLRCLR